MIGRLDVFCRDFVEMLSLKMMLHHLYFQFPVGSHDCSVLLTRETSETDQPK